MLSPLLIIFAALLLATLTWLKTRWQNQTFATAHGCLPAPRYQQPETILGVQNVVEAARAWKANTWLEMWYHRFTTIGPTFQASSLGRTTIFTIDPENVKAVLATKFKHFDLGPRRMKILGPLTGPGIFTNDGTSWEHSRSLVRPTFTKVQPDRRSGSVEADLQPLFFRLTLDSATELLLGRSFGSLLSPPGSNALRFMHAFDYAQCRIHVHGLRESPALRPFAWIQSLFAAKKKSKFDEACETVHRTLDGSLPSSSREEKEAPGGKEKYVFLHEIANETRDPLQLRHETLNLLLAGRDTTAALLSNTFFVLARRPDIWARLRSEIDQTFEGSIPDYDGLRTVKYIRNLLNESLRLYPVVPWNSRIATENTTLPHGGGPDGRSPVFVRAGQLVNYHLWSMHRMPEHFGPDSHVFNPDRWDDSTLRPGWACIPFNGGPPICVGQQYALTQAAYVVVRLVQQFESIECHDASTPWSEHVGLVTSSRTGTKVSLRPRNMPR
ncbi:Uu.00g014960.m01.CDS01 [Anthostomella pinea]|uniref:Uu.00g014960.m01.CDS01 n=1 Tax=Anthostomella pinea TaxID=933095 RepID=A0AAI8VYG9_9PEZI|nr:Uu.00g014960.m01.CDS01 [Anthostomella pinea]